MNPPTKRLRTMPVVVLFKSEADGRDKFTKLLEENDFDVRTITCIDFQFKDSELLLEKLRNADRYEGIIFTSQRAVQAVHKAVAQHEALTGWIGKSNYSVGESTSELARNLVDLETKGQQTGNAKELATFIISIHRDKATKPFLFPSGNLKQDILETDLKAEAIIVECVETYETLQHPKLDESIESLTTAKVDFLVYFSPSGVKFSMPILIKHKINLDDLKIIALGPSTKKSLEENDLRCHRVCKNPSPESLLEALTRLPSGE